MIPNSTNILSLSHDSYQISKSSVRYFLMRGYFFLSCAILPRLYIQQLKLFSDHYDDVIMTMLASQITSLPVVCSIVYSDVNQRKHQSSASLAFVREIHRGPVNFPHKWPVTRKMFPFDDVIMEMNGICK